MIVIGNENGDIQVLEIKAINNLKSVLYKENKLKIGNNSITSILGLKDGKLVISKKENEKIEMIGNENICPENCIIIWNIIKIKYKQKISFNINFFMS